MTQPAIAAYSYFLFPSPVGTLALFASPTAIVGLSTRERLTLWLDRQDCTHSHIVLEEAATPLLLLGKQQLEEYFCGTRRQFTLPLEFHGSEFQKKVWQQIAAIPFGSTCTYGQIAAAIGTRGAQAVGTAVGHNPIPILIPCHRVLPANGSLGKFSFPGGPAVKQRLLALEGVFPPASAPSYYRHCYAVNRPNTPRITKRIPDAR